MLKKLMIVLAAWFLAEWFYTTKLKPFIVSEFGGSSSTASAPAGSSQVAAGGDTTTLSGYRHLTDSLRKRLSTLAAGNGLINLANLRSVTDSFTYGLDISHYQGDLISKLNKKEDSLYFVICKATEGTSYKDPQFDNNWSILQGKKVIRGAYHFYQCSADPVAQAKNFIKVITADSFLTISELPPVLDIENSSMDDCNGGDLKTIQQNVLAFLNEVQKSTGRIPMIYTNKSTGNKYLNDPVFAAYPLWVAAYTSTLTPDYVPLAWNNQWTMWQRSESYSFQGENFDYDVFRGSRLQLRRFILKTIVKKEKNP